MREYVMYMGLKQKLTFELSIEFSLLAPKRKIFNTTTNHDNCIWITPFNKGNLWKIKRTYQAFYVYYGTIQKIYATSLKDCLNFINQQP